MPDTKTLAVELLQSTNPKTDVGRDRIAITQTQHRLDLLSAWFGSLEAAKTSLADKTVLEIGCGQGDMTVVLAWAVGSSGTVHAVDPARLDYGAPETLGEAQARISASELGSRIQWKQSDPVEAIRADLSLLDADYIILAHSLLYMKSTEYLAALFEALASAKSTSASQTPTTLLIAEWGMRVSNESAKAHLDAVQIQAAQPLHEGNVRMYIEPKMTVELALDAGWKTDKEVWIESPDLDDGAWEVSAARSISVAADADESTRKVLEELKNVSLKPVRSMDVWTCVLRC